VTVETSGSWTWRVTVNDGRSRAASGSSSVEGAEGVREAPLPPAAGSA
jgi:hypothetical protein